MGIRAGGWLSSTYRSLARLDRSAHLCGRAYAQGRTGRHIYWRRDLDGAAAAASLRAPLPGRGRAGPAVRADRDRHPARRPVGAAPGHRRPHRRRRPAAGPRRLRGLPPRHRGRRRVLPLPDAAALRHRVPRHRVRHPQRLPAPPAAPAAGLLPGPPDRRPDVARHQRPVGGADDGRAGGDVRGLDRHRLRRRHRPDAVDRSVADRDGADPAAVRVAGGLRLRHGDPSTLRADPGPALRAVGGDPGSAGRRPGRARLPAGGGRTGPLPPGQRGVPAPQPAADRPPGAVLSEPHVPARRGRARGAVAGRPRGDRRPADRRRVRRLQRLPGDARLADDRVRLGHQPAAARLGVVGPDARGARRAAGHRRRPARRRPGAADRRHRVAAPDVRLPWRAKPDGDAARVLHDISLTVPAGHDARDRRPHRQRQVDAGQPAAAALRSAARHGVRRRHRRPRPAARRPARQHRHGAAGAVPVQRHDRRQRRVRDPRARRDRGPRSTPSRSPASTSTSRRSRTAGRPRSASAA